MSTTDITIGEDFWQGDDEAVLTTWYFDDRDSVAEGDTVAEIMLEKTQMEIEAPASGKLHIITTADQPIKKGTVIGKIGD